MNLANVWVCAFADKVNTHSWRSSTPRIHMLGTPSWNLNVTHAAANNKHIAYFLAFLSPSGDPQIHAPWIHGNMDPWIINLLLACYWLLIWFADLAIDMFLTSDFNCWPCYWPVIDFILLLTSIARFVDQWNKTGSQIEIPWLCI
mgnify:CR=1 FL=1